MLEDPLFDDIKVYFKNPIDDNEEVIYITMKIVRISGH